MWSVGVVTYVLLVGYPPFMEDKQQDLFRKIRSGEYEFDNEDWTGISEDAIALIKRLLVVEPQQRLTAVEALNQPWFNDGNIKRLSSRSLTASLNSIRQKRSRLRSIATAVMWLTNAGKDDLPVKHVPFDDGDEMSES